MAAEDWIDFDWFDEDERAEPILFFCKFCHSTKLLAFAQDFRTGKWFAAEEDGKQHVCQAKDQFDALP